MKYGNGDMRLMAIGEMGAAVIGPVAAANVVLLMEDYPIPLIIAGAIVVWVASTLMALAIVHHGYDAKDRI